MRYGGGLFRGYFGVILGFFWGSFWVHFGFSFTCCFGFVLVPLVKVHHVSHLLKTVAFFRFVLSVKYSCFWMPVLLCTSLRGRKNRQKTKHAKKDALLFRSFVCDTVTPWHCETVNLSTALISSSRTWGVAVRARPC